MDRRDDFFALGEKELLIVPGHADASRLIDIVSGKEKDMKSAAEHLLSVSEISMLKVWIEAGADWPQQRSTIQPTE